MPILAVDAMGKLYVTSPDREDGLGYGSSPECVSQGDVTLGSSYLKAGAQRTASLLKSKRDQRSLDSRDLKAQQIAARNRQLQAIREGKEIEMMNNPEIHKAAQKKALAMGCPCDYSTPMSGNVMTANGQYGVRGMNRNDQVIYNAVNGLGSSMAFKADPIELEQHRMKIQTDRLLRLKARR